MPPRKPVKPPSAPMTRWQGTMTGIALRPFAAPPAARRSWRRSRHKNTFRRTGSSRARARPAFGSRCRRARAAGRMSCRVQRNTRGVCLRVASMIAFVPGCASARGPPCLPFSKERPRSATSSATRASAPIGLWWSYRIMALAPSCPCVGRRAARASQWHRRARDKVPQARRELSGRRCCPRQQFHRRRDRLLAPARENRQSLVSASDKMAHCAAVFDVMGGYLEHGRKTPTMAPSAETPIRPGAAPKCGCYIEPVA